MTSSVERKENDSDDDMYGMLEIYEQCEYILWIVNEKKTKQNKKTRGHIHVTQNQNHSNMNNKKIK